MPSPSSTTTVVLKRLVPLLFLFVAAAVLPAPTRPSVMTDFFASRELSKPVSCGYGSGPSGEDGNGEAFATACARAHSSAAFAASASDFFGNSLALIVAPAFGRASDEVLGRRRKGRDGRTSRRSLFLSLALLSSALPPLALALHSSSNSPSPLFYLYFLFSSLATAAPGAAICLAYAADALPKGKRAPAFSAVSAAVSAGLLFGSAAGAALSASTAARVATAGVVCCAAAAFFLPEVVGAGATAEEARRATTSAEEARRATTTAEEAARRATTTAEEARRATTTATSTSTATPSSPLSAFSLLTKTKQATLLLSCVVLSGAASQGLSDTIAQFLQQRLNFVAGDQALLLCVAGGGGVLTQAFVVPTLLRDGSSLRVRGEAGLLRLGLAASLLEHLMLALFATTKASALAAVGVGALGGGLAFPAASALASDLCGGGGGGSGSGEGGGGGAGTIGRGRQGEVQGALSAARSGAAAVGPVLFGGIYYLSSRAAEPSLSSLPSRMLRGAPFLFGSVLLATSLALSLRIEQPALVELPRQLPCRAGEEDEGQRRRSTTEEEEAPLLVAAEP